MLWLKQIRIYKVLDCAFYESEETFFTRLGTWNNTTHSSASPTRQNHSFSSPQGLSNPLHSNPTTTYDYMIHEINIRFYPLFFPPVNHQTFFFLFFPNLVSSPLKNLRRSHSDFSWRYLSRFSPRAYRSAYTYKFSFSFFPFFFFFFAIISFLGYLRGGWLVDSLIH